MAGPHELEFAESNVDDAWLEHLKALPDLESVRLRGAARRAPPGSRPQGTDPNPNAGLKRD